MAGSVVISMIFVFTGPGPPVHIYHAILHSAFCHLPSAILSPMQTMDGKDGKV